MVAPPRGSGSRLVAPAFAWLIATWVALLLPPAAPRARAADTDPEVRRLKPGVFLYASPRLREPNFSETVVLLVDYGPKGAMGLVIDRPTKTVASEVLKNAKSLGSVPIYWGGPVQPETVFGLVHSDKPPKGSLSVLPDVYLTGKRKDLDAAMKAGDAARRVRIYVGYAGWGQGQLEGEVLRNGWLVSRGDASLVFSAEPEKVWRKAYQLLDRLEALDLSGPGVVARSGFGSREP